MLKRFLKFLKGDDPNVVERFEGSYLDHLLEQIQPRVAEQVNECPEHDPLLLVVVGILRQTMMNVWDPRTTEPLLDSQSPGVPSGFTAPAAETSEFEAYEDVDDSVQFEIEEPGSDTSEIDASVRERALMKDDTEADSDSPDVSDGDDSDRDDSDSDDSDQEEGTGLNEDSVAEFQKNFSDADDERSDWEDDETLDQPPPSPGDGGWNRITEEIDVSEIRAHADEAGRDSTLELDREEMLERARNREMQRPRVDTEDVLQAGRLYLALLIENDRLPTDLQLSVAETMVARDMLLGYFIGSDEVADNAHRILALVEQKFRDGLFGQARILLELFHTNEHSWVQEEHKIFYEDMILKLGIRRRNRLSESEVAAFQGHLDRATDNEGISGLASWLSRQCLISFHLYMRDPDRVSSWDAVLEPVTLEDARETFDLYVPPRRWRPLDSYDTIQPTEQIVRHVGAETAREYVLRHLKTCFVVLRAHGDTGLETYLDSFFNWMESSLDFNGTAILPGLYRRSMMDNESMEEILESAYEEHFEELVESKLDDLEESEIVAALFASMDKLRQTDIADVAPGYYDLGGFVFDELFGFEAPDPQFSFKIHRLS